MRKICGTCDHWIKRPSERKGKNELVVSKLAGYCRCDKFVTGWVYKQANETPPDGLAHLDQLNQWVSTFETGEFFGCVHWIAKFVRSNNEAT